MMHRNTERAPLSLHDHTGVLIRLFSEKTAVLFGPICLLDLFPIHPIRFLFCLRLLAAQYSSGVYYSLSFIAQLRAWRCTLLEFQQTVICLSLRASGGGETALDCLRICNKVYIWTASRSRPACHLLFCFI